MQEQVFLKRGAGTFPIYYFQVLLFLQYKLFWSLQNGVMHLNKNKFFLSLQFYEKSNKLSKNENPIN